MGKMSDEIRKKRLAELLGMDVPEPEAPPGIEDDTNSREAEGVIAYFQTPQLFKEIECAECGKPFAVNRANVSRCSDHCRARYLESIGIIWDKTKPPHERWDMKEPLVVPPPALELLKQMEVPEGLQLPVPLAE